MSIDQLILNFRDFLLLSWPSIEKVMDIMDWDDDFYHLDDWMQANWELLVERNLHDIEALSSYGICYPDSRYSDLKVASHRVVCQQKGQVNAEKYIFRGFQTVWKNTHSTAPPFEIVSAYKIDSKEFCKFSIDDVEFNIESIK